MTKDDGLWRQLVVFNLDLVPAFVGEVTGEASTAELGPGHVPVEWGELGSPFVGVQCRGDHGVLARIEEQGDGVAGELKACVEVWVADHAVLGRSDPPVGEHLVSERMKE